MAQYLAVFFGYENNDSRDAERSRGDTKPLATQATQRSRPAKRDYDEEGDKFERNLKKIGNSNLTCKTNRIPETKKNSYIYNAMWLFLILHHKTLFFSLAFPMCKRGFSSMKLLIVQTGRLEM